MQMNRTPARGCELEGELGECCDRDWFQEDTAPAHRALRLEKPLASPPSILSPCRHVSPLLRRKGCICQMTAIPQPTILHEILEGIGASCSSEDYFALAADYSTPDVTFGVPQALQISSTQGFCSGDDARGAFTQAVWQKAIDTYGG